MLRIQPITNAKHAESYYSKSDGGYYLDGTSLRCEWGGKGAVALGLTGPPDFEHFKRLIHGLDPNSGEQLTAKLVGHRIPGWDVNLHCAKGVTLALEGGDGRIRDAFWEAAREAMADIEQHATTRVRKGNKQDDRITGNLVWYAVEHAETRPAKDDSMPDPHRHMHVVVFNLTRDPVENEWKAVKFRPIMDQRKWFDRRFNMRFAAKLTQLGYEVESKWKSDGKGDRKYQGWDIKGIPPSAVKTFSRRTAEVEKLAAELGLEHRAREKDKLGATSRQAKRADLTLADCRDYWNSRLSPAEARLIADTIDKAKQGRNPPPRHTLEQAVAFAIEDHFERRSVVHAHELAITAMERCMGVALPEDIMAEARKQGLLVKGSEVTTRAVLAEEAKVIAFARAGRGLMAPLRLDSLSLSSEQLLRDGGLSADQKSVARHVWDSTDQMILIRGPAGTGKTRTMRTAVDGIEKPVVVLAPSAEASRGVLRSDEGGGFAAADTVARFLEDKQFQEQARGGVIWVDESGLLGFRHVARLVEIAGQLDARIVLQGDKRQHGSVERGSVLHVLETYGGLPVAELKDIHRQKGDYMEAVKLLGKGDMAGGFDKLLGMGWVRQVDGHQALVGDYLAGLDAGKKMLVVAPTHAEGEAITGAIRNKLKERGIIGNEERVFPQLQPLGWTNAQKGDLGHYDGREVLQFHRNSGSFKAGQRISVAQWQPGQVAGKPSNYSVYEAGELRLSPGDVVRMTAGGHDITGKHRLNNGSRYKVKGFTAAGNIQLTNGWVLAADVGHIAHGIVSTSHAAQGKTVDRVLIGMGRESLPAIDAEQFYVSVSRGRDSARIYSDMPRDELREAVKGLRTRKSATELMGLQFPGPHAKRALWDRLRTILKKGRDRLRQLHQAVGRARETTPSKEQHHGRSEREL